MFSSLRRADRDALVKSLATLTLTLVTAVANAPAPWSASDLDAAATSVRVASATEQTDGSATTGKASDAKGSDRKAGSSRSNKRGGGGETAPINDNPLAGHRMGVYMGPGDQAWAPYTNSIGTNRELLAKIALRPKAKWFGAWIPDQSIRSNVAEYIANSTGGDPSVLVQMTVFRMVPWEHEACGRLPTPNEQASYRYWIDEFAAGVSDSHAAIVLQPDGPFALCAPGGSRLPSELVKYAANKFAALPNTQTYIDGGAADWPKDNPAEAAEILVRAGVDQVRGFALNSTHYVALPEDIEFGTQVVAELARRGIPGKHFVVNTSSNGRGFEFSLGRGNHPDNANVCRTPEERICVTLGIPPTTDVANPRWGLSPENAARAAEHIDAYLWFGRPWLNMQNDPFVLDRALAMARTTPW